MYREGCYIYIYIEREREIYIYIYMYIHTLGVPYMYTLGVPSPGGPPGEAEQALGGDQ